LGLISRHEFLVNVAAFLASNVVAGPGGIIPSAGVLLKNYGYELKLPELEKILTFFGKSGEKVPDLCMINSKNGILLVFECKSGITDTKDNTDTNNKLRFIEQIKFFKSEQFQIICKKIYNAQKIEIVVMTYNESLNDISQIIEKDIVDTTSIIVWTIPQRIYKESTLRREYGKHEDRYLDEGLQHGIIFEPPVNDMLIDPTIPDNILLCRILSRLLSWYSKSMLIREDTEQIITVDKFKKTHEDWIRSDERLKDLLRYLSILVPELGTYDRNRNEYIIKLRPRIGAILKKQKDIQQMSDRQFKEELRRRAPKQRLRGRPLTGRIKLKSKDKGALEPFLRK